MDDATSTHSPAAADTGGNDVHPGARLLSTSATAGVIAATALACVAVLRLWPTAEMRIIGLAVTVIMCVLAVKAVVAMWKAWRCWAECVTPCTDLRHMKIIAAAAFLAAGGITAAVSAAFMPAVFAHVAPVPVVAVGVGYAGGMLLAFAAGRWEYRHHRSHNEPEPAAAG